MVRSHSLVTASVYRISMGKTPAPFGTVLDRSYNDGTPVAKGDIVLWRQARYFVLAMNGSKKKEGLYVFPIEAVTLICPVASTSGVHYPLDKSVPSPSHPCMFFP